MSTAIYKPGQGYYTRTMSAIGLSLIALMGVAWLWRLLATVRSFGQEPVVGQAAAAILVILVLGILGYWLIGVNQRVVDFMVATEGEMKKVNWSSRREIMGSTGVVIAVTVFLAAFCFVFDYLFTVFFTWIKVLET